MAMVRWLAVIVLGAALAGISTGEPQQQAQQTARQPTEQKASQSSGNAARPPDPLVEAARHAREAQKTQSKPAKVWTNADLPTAGGLSITGTPAESTARPAENAAKPQNDKGSGSEVGNASEDAAAIQAELDTAKKNLKDLQTQLDLLQRTYKLDQQMYYVNPSYSSDTAGAAKLKNEEAQIGLRQQDVAKAQKAVDDLQAKLEAAKAAPGDSAH